MEASNIKAMREALEKADAVLSLISNLLGSLMLTSP